MLSLLAVVCKLEKKIRCHMKFRKYSSIYSIVFRFILVILVVLHYAFSQNDFPSSAATENSLKSCSRFSILKILECIAYTNTKIQIQTEHSHKLPYMIKTANRKANFLCTNRNPKHIELNASIV